MRGLVQLTLDFFATPEAASGSSPARPADAENTRQTAVEFRHPHANRQIRLADATVAYQFKRGQRRTIGFSIGADGLVVSAPRWVRMSDVQAALREKAAWIVRKLHEARVRQERQLASRITWRDGAELPFLGRPLRLLLDPTQACSNGDAQMLAEAQGMGGTLRLGLPQHATEAQIRDAVQKIFGVTVTSVHTMIFRGKERRMGCNQQTVCLGFWSAGGFIKRRAVRCCARQRHDAHREFTRGPVVAALDNAVRLWKQQQGRTQLRCQWCGG